MNATLVKIRMQAENIYSLDFYTSDPIKHNPGQYVNLILAHENVDSRGKERWFSLSSAPNTKGFQVTTKFIPGASSSFKKALFKLRTGDNLAVSTAMGDFVMPVDKRRKLLFVAAGIGITPFLSMLKFLEKNAENRYIVMFYAVNNRNELIDIDKYKKHLRELRLFISKEGNKLSPELIFKQAKSMDKPLIYIAGPEQMTESFRDELIKLSIKREDIVGDYFDGY